MSHVPHRGLNDYRKDIVELIGDIGRMPFTYGWYRTLDDTGSLYYSLACRITNICPTCLREWGQAYYANNCDHHEKSAPAGKE